MECDTFYILEQFLLEGLYMAMMSDMFINNSHLSAADTCQMLLMR